MKTMPAKPQPPVMTPDELRALLAASAYAGESPAKVAELVGFSRVQWWRLLSGKTNISERSARLIRAKLKPKKK